MRPGSRFQATCRIKAGVEASVGIHSFQSCVAVDEVLAVGITLQRPGIDDTEAASVVEGAVDSTGGGEASHVAVSGGIADRAEDGNAPGRLDHDPGDAVNIDRNGRLKPEVARAVGV